MGSSSVFRQCAEFLVSLGSLTVAALAYAWMNPLFMPFDDRVPSMVLSAVLFWFVAQAYDPEQAFGTRTKTIRMTLVGTGAILSLQAILIWVSRLSALPLFVVLCAGGLAGLLVGALRAGPFRQRPRVLLVGDPEIFRDVVPGLGGSVVGVLELTKENSARIPDIPVVGPAGNLTAVIEKFKPTKILAKEGQISARELLLARSSGISVDDPVEMYRKLFQRTPVRELTPLKVLNNPTLSTSRQIMAFQAIYSNLAGLLLLVMLAPLILLIGVVSRLAAGSGPIFERVRSIGLDEVPFDRFRFRTRRASDGRPTWIGNLLLTLHMENLPQLMNVIRGELTLFGPPPIRKECFDRLKEIMPICGLRATHRPGVLGWSQVHRRRERVQEEILRLEYDLYYIQESSPSLDFDIVLRTVWRFLGLGSKS
jgi:lipopolysaccharide/colanic/teichoic acid biosynthesis glycosyltransferase